MELLKTNACPSPFMCDPACRYYGYGDCFPDRFADHLIANGVTVQDVTDINVGNKWISVKDRLPQEKGEICKNVIMFMDDGLVTVGWLNEDIQFAFYLDTRDDLVSKVPISRCTHWMPLPEPPKEGE